MNRISKWFAVFIILVMILSSLSLLMVKPASAQLIPKPSVPEFTLHFVGSPYNALVVTVKNQPYDSAFGTMYYNIRLKDHNSGNDSWIYPLDQLFFSYHTYPEQSTDSEYTNISITVQSNFLLLGTQNDIAVEAMIGNIGRDAHYNPAPYVFNGQTSDWRNTQTITIPASSSSTSPNPTQSPTNTVSPTPTVPEISWLAILPLFVLSLFIGVRLRHRNAAKIHDFPLKALITQKPIFP
jgi:hypothetical protein